MTEDRGSPAAPGDDEQPLATGEPRPARSEYAGSRPRPFRAPERSSSRTRFVPLLADLRGTTVGRLRPDLLAGVTIAALAVPQGSSSAAPQLSFFFHWQGG